MTVLQDPPRPATQTGAESEKSARKERLGAALRENLRRRKIQRTGREARADSAGCEDQDAAAAVDPPSVRG